MASIFTYDPDPPRVSSPWLAPDDAPYGDTKESVDIGSFQPAPGLLSEYGLTKLEAEPQQGPTEYKLHLLLRPRRAYKSMSTAQDGRTSGLGDVTSSPKSLPSTLAASHQTRQHRLQHLTTQLLWRLQQSSPYHASSSKQLKIPRLPYENTLVDEHVMLDPLAPGLEESKGALYEIGVSDDGTLVGLTRDELDESISVLRIMAASLGCSVEIVRKVIVGDCEWIESMRIAEDSSSDEPETIRYDRLWVAEALVTPHMGLKFGRCSSGDEHLQPAANEDAPESPTSDAANSRGISSTPQLRITLTGPTTSGKSSLLGTLSTGTLDNGRGKSRLSLLKHRHEMVSGVTSSIAQELIGYKDRAILNFAQGNIESWIDIHDRAENGRLVFVTDSGGHPRYRRTVLRGLMNWAPHWSVLCIAADDAQEATPSSGVNFAAEGVMEAPAANIDLIQAHLTLSLKLDVPMAIVITKLDLASKLSLQRTMSKVLSAIKEAGRTPKILQPDQRANKELEHVTPEDHEKVMSVVDSMVESESLTKSVPIVLTSVVKGTGIGLVHALLESLPLPPSPSPHDFIGMALNPEQPRSLFHVDDTFTLPASNGAWPVGSDRYGDQGMIVSGYLRFGDVSVGDNVIVGPFPSEDDDLRAVAPDDQSSPNPYGLSISHPSSAELARITMKTAISASALPGEWHQARIVSIRNLRLPVWKLEGGQAGSVGLVFEPTTDSVDQKRAAPRIRRGMVLAIPSKHMRDTGLSLQAASGFAATFYDPAIESLAVGSFVNVYVASIRAAARVLGITHHRDSNGPQEATPDNIDVFDLSGGMDDGKIATEKKGSSIRGAEVFFELLHTREWIEMGSQIILLEGGSQHRSGLEGFVGKVIEIVD